MLLHLDSCNVSSERNLQIKCHLHVTVMMVRTLNKIISVLHLVMKGKPQCHFFFLLQENNFYPQGPKTSRHHSRGSALTPEMNTCAFHANVMVMASRQMLILIIKLCFSSLYPFFLCLKESFLAKL